MTSPFDWKNQPPKISMRDLDIANKCSYQTSVTINKRRAAGIEPSIIYSSKPNESLPGKFAISMPVMPLHKRTKRKKK